jgi:hypothetical protein
MTLFDPAVHDFCREAVQTGAVFTIGDAVAYPLPLMASGRRAMPFWSSRHQAQAIIDGDVGLRAMSVEVMALDRFLSECLPDLVDEDLGVCLNWSGRDGSDTDVCPKATATVLRRLGAAGVTAPEATATERNNCPCNR